MKYAALFAALALVALDLEAPLDGTVAERKHTPGYTVVRGSGGDYWNRRVISRERAAELTNQLVRRARTGPISAAGALACFSPRLMLSRTVRCGYSA